MTQCRPAYLSRLLVSIAFVGMLIIVPMHCFAALNLELTQGIRAAIPVAIVPFANGSSAPVAGNTTITKVISNDLQNSGQFRVVTPGFMDQKPTNLSQVNFGHWRKVGVNDLVIGAVTTNGNGQYNVSFQLVNVFNDKNATSSAVLLNQSFKVGASGLRQLAHHISDLIYQKLTGIRGIFSTKIAYILVQRANGKPSKYTLEVADADGFDPRPMLVSTQPIMSPAWMPNGQDIAYVSFEGHHASIYLQNVATGKRQLISDFPGVNGAPDFSPSGNKIALVLSRTGSPKIYVLNLQTHRLTQITHGYSIDTEPNWAPDGKSILFTSNRGGTPQIYRYTLATGQIQRITFDGNYNARASFLPNEQGIIMMHRETGLFGIAKQNLQTGQLTVLTQAGSDESPSVAPNGKMVLYATNYGGRGVLALVSTDGRIKLRLPAREGNVQEPAWSPYLTT